MNAAMEITNPISGGEVLNKIPPVFLEHNVIKKTCVMKLTVPIRRVRIDLFPNDENASRRTRTPAISS